MKKLLLFIFPLVLCGTAEAARVTCSGESMGYRYVLRANVRGRHVVGPIRAAISGGMFAAGRTVSLVTTSSSIRPGSYLRATARGPGVAGTIVASYDPSSGLYIGTVSVQAAGGGGSGSVACRLSGPRAPDGFLDEE